MRIRRIESILFAIAFASTTARAAMPDASPNARAEITNWQAPETWTPPAAIQDPDGAKQDADAAALSGVRSVRNPLIIASPTPVMFVPITPCRVMDTRGNGQTGNFGTPQLGVNVTRTIAIPTHPTCTGVPANVAAYSLNLAVTNTGPQAFGYLQVWPTGQTQPNASNLNYPGAGATLANSTVVAAGTSGQIEVFSGNASADVIIDINGYYGPTGSLPSGSAYLGNTAAATATYTYPVTVTLPTGGACLVLSNVQFSLGTLPTTQGPFFRIGVKRGAAVDTDDGLFGFYFVPPGTTGKSNDMTRHAIISINPNESTQLGCFVSSTTDANWQTFYRCRTSYLCF